MKPLLIAALFFGLVGCGQRKNDYMQGWTTGYLRGLKAGGKNVYDINAARKDWEIDSIKYFHSK